MKKTFFPIALLLAVVLLTSAVPTLSASAASESDLSAVSSEYILTVNIETGTVLYERHAGGGNYTYCGFLPRIMLCAMLFESGIDLNETFTLTDKILSEAPKRRTETFSSGDKVSLGDLAKSILIANSQEACVALAVRLAGSTEACVERLNAKAKSLGMNDTTISNVHGYFNLSDPGWTTLEDVMKAVAYALKQDNFRDFANPAKEPAYIKVSGASKPLYHSNCILSSSTKYYNRKALGIAAFSTDNADWYAACDMVMDGSMPLVTIVISMENLDTAWKDMNVLLGMSIEKYKTLTVAPQGKVMAQIPVTRGKTRDNVLAVTDKEIVATVPESVGEDEFTFEVSVPETLKAPIAKGAGLGSVICRYRGEVYAERALVAQTDVAADEIELFSDELDEFFSDKTVWIVIGSVIAVVILYLVASHAAAKKKKERKRVRISKRS